MSAAVLYFTHGIGDFGNTFIAKINRTFLKIGYIRAATELNKLGYPEEANRCIRLMKSL